jgi:hypothetical protein
MTVKKGNRELLPAPQPIHCLTEIRESRPTQWATLEELLDKLLFLAVSGDGARHHFVDYYTE